LDIGKISVVTLRALGNLKICWYFFCCWFS